MLLLLLAMRAGVTYKIEVKLIPLCDRIQFSEKKHYI